MFLFLFLLCAAAQQPPRPGGAISVTPYTLQFVDTFQPSSSLNLSKSIASALSVNETRIVVLSTNTSARPFLASSAFLPDWYNVSLSYQTPVYLGSQLISQSTNATSPLLTLLPSLNTSTPAQQSVATIIYFCYDGQTFAQVLSACPSPPPTPGPGSSTPSEPFLKTGGFPALMLLILIAILVLWFWLSWWYTKKEIKKRERYERDKERTKEQEGRA